MARILNGGQAPGVRARTRGIPWDDPGGRRLREWMGVSAVEFYDQSRIATIPMAKTKSRV
jgi:uracil-DNA glycosylase